LVSVRAPIGAVNLADQEYGIGRGLCAIRTNKSNNKYLYYLFICILFINHGNSLCYEELCFANRVLETCVKFIIFCLCKVYHYF
jgi:restriction endonuclease S subunit